MPTAAQGDTGFASNWDFTRCEVYRGVPQDEVANKVIDRCINKLRFSSDPKTTVYKAIFEKEKNIPELKDLVFGELATRHDSLTEEQLENAKMLVQAILQSPSDEQGVLMSAALRFHSLAIRHKGNAAALSLSNEAAVHQAAA